MKQVISIRLGNKVLASLDGIMKTTNESRNAIIEKILEQYFTGRLVPAEGGRYGKQLDEILYTVKALYAEKSAAIAQSGGSVSPAQGVIQEKPKAQKAEGAPYARPTSEEFQAQMKARRES